MNCFLRRYETITTPFPKPEELISHKRERDATFVRQQSSETTTSDARDTEYTLNQKAVRLFKSSDTELKIHTYYHQIIFLIQIHHWLRFHAYNDSKSGRLLDTNIILKRMRAYIIFIAPCIFPELLTMMETDKYQYPMPNDAFRMLIMTWYRTNGIRLFSIAIDPKINYKTILLQFPTLIDATRTQALNDLSVILNMLHAATKHK